MALKKKKKLSKRWPSNSPTPRETSVSKSGPPQRYFLHAPTIKVEEVTCEIDGCGYKPGTMTFEPVRAFRSHQRTKHKIYMRPYVIEEEP